jgi:glycosidase
MNRILTKFAIILAVQILEGFAIPTKEQQTFDGSWLFKVDLLNRGVKEQWFRKDFERSGWTKVNVPDYWERYKGYDTYDGIGWFARTFEVADINQPLSFFFGGVDDDADVWVNGEAVGSHRGYSEPFSFVVGRALKVGVNEIVVRVVDYSGPGGIYKPITLIGTDEVERLFRTKYASMLARESANWVKDAVIYEVYLRSFSNEGTFQALEAKISELKKLGVTIVWLMPIHPVGKINRKGFLGSPYSVQDYYGVNPEFGTLDDINSLVNTIHQQGLKIIIDLVANHTAWDNPMLKEHPEWYTHDKKGAIISPNPDWTDVADLNYDQPGLRTSMITMMKYWVHDVGIDGFRCDVAELVPTDFWESARKELDAIKPVMMLSEGTLPEHHIKAFDLTYSWNVYDVLEKVIKGSTHVTILDKLLKSESNRYPQGSLRMRFNTNHDKNAYDGPPVKKFTPEGAKATAVLMFTYPGVPMIYNGEEVGNEKKLNLFEKEDIDWSKGGDFRGLYETLGMLHKEHPALRRGSFLPVQNSDSTIVYSFMRTMREDTVLVVINFNTFPQKVNLILPTYSSTSWKDFFSKQSLQLKTNRLEVTMPRLGFAVLCPMSEVK